MAEKHLKIELATPDSKQSIEPALSCSAPGVLGRFQILPNHAAFISELAVGEIKIVLPEKTRYFATSGGFLEVVDNKVLLLLETAEPAERIDVARADQAKERASERLHNKKASLDVPRAEAALARALNRLKVAERASP